MGQNEQENGGKLVSNLIPHRMGVTPASVSDGLKGLGGMVY